MHHDNSWTRLLILRSVCAEARAAHAIAKRRAARPCASCSRSWARGGFRPRSRTSTLPPGG
eukprot:3041943-Lingulodinium_polyedra.AAC.1